MADGFLGRWSRRKLDAKEGRPVEAEPPAPPVAGVASAPVTQAPAPEPVPAEPLPTLEDVQALTPESDFRRFTQPGVAPEVKRAAMKKLFADPRFNVQDGLDVYIGDYNTPDPMPESMIRQLAGAQFLGLFREEERKDEPQAGARDGAEAEGNASVAQSGAARPDEPAAPSPPAVPPDHADPDLRLQQDDAAEGGEPGRGAG